jgi:hypothetical protein
VSWEGREVEDRNGHQEPGLRLKDEWPELIQTSEEVLLHDG